MRETGEVSSASGQDMEQRVRELELDALRAHVEKLRQDRAARSPLTAELIAAFTYLHRRDRRTLELRSNAELRGPSAGDELAYELGRVMIRNFRSPIGWLKMPIALWRAYDRWQRRGGHTKPGTGDRHNPIALQPGQSVLLPLMLDEQQITVKATQGCGDIYVTALCADPADVVTMQLGVQSRSEEPGADSAPNVRLFAFERKHLLSVDLGAMETLVRFYRLRGPICVLRFELETHTGDGSAANRRGTSQRTDTIWRAQEMIREGRASEAVEFALAHASETERPAVHLLHAVVGKQDESAWLWHVNRYLEQYAIAPVRLTKEGPSRFSRISAPVGRVVSGGPLVSVIMTAFDAGETLECAAASILRQTWQPLELIIVDDCSRDATWEVVRKIAGLDARVKRHRNAVNVGPYVSRNLALSMARGEYITCQDADDWAHPERIEKQVEAMRADGRELKASVGGMLRIDETGEFNSFTMIGETSHDGALRLAHVSCMFAADFMRRYVGHWDSVRFGADGEMMHRVQHVLGEGFVRQRQLLMFCLDARNSLTNDPLHGISRTHGLSPVRRSYRDYWRAWHSGIELDTAYLPFPHERRRFAAPEECLVPAGSIARVLAESMEQGSSDDPELLL